LLEREARIYGIELLRATFCMLFTQIDTQLDLHHCTAQENKSTKYAAPHRSQKKFTASEWVRFAICGWREGLPNDEGHSTYLGNSP
jgi:hypothetical protein